MQTPRPTAPRIIAENIPAELTSLPRWVGWRYEWVDAKWDKVPVSCTTGRRADVTRSSSWCGFDVALGHAREHALDGIGFAFHEGDPFAGIDLDGCRDAGTGRLQAWAADIIKAVDSYSEVSPSGNGVHVIVEGMLPIGGRNRRGNIEVYSDGRYFTVTGGHLGATPKAVEPRQVRLGQVQDRLARSDDDIIRVARRAKNGDKFARLWDGDVGGYDSASEADLALCGMLAYWTACDAQRMERMFSNSVLAERSKWADRKDYRDVTIDRAVAGQWTQVLTRGDRGTKSIQITRSKQEKTRSRHTHEWH